MESVYPRFIAAFLVTLPFMCLLYNIYYRKIVTRDAEFLIGILEKDDEAWDREKIIALVRDYCSEKIYFYCTALRSNSPYEDEAALELGLQKYRSSNFLKNNATVLPDREDILLERFCDPYCFEIHAVFNYYDPLISNIAIVKVQYAAERMDGGIFDNRSDGGGYKSHYYICRFIEGKWVIDAVIYTKILPILSHVKNKKYAQQLSKMKQKKWLITVLVYLAFLLFLSVFNKDIYFLINGLKIGFVFFLLILLSHFTIKLLFFHYFNRYSAEKLKQAV